MMNLTKMIGQQFQKQRLEDEEIPPGLAPQERAPHLLPVVNGAEGAPPPPPPPPPPPRPGFWRFPEAEFANKIWHH